MDERKIQHDLVMQFFSRREDEGGLGYRQVSSNIVSNDLFIPSLLGEFVKTSKPEVWERLLRQHGNDEQELQTALKDKVKATLLDAQNVATFINTHRTITFEGESIPLLYVSGAELRGDEDFKKNIFAVVEESNHNVMLGNEKIYGIRPDITFFLNGIYIGYLELKTVSQGQTARDNGRQKVVKDYLATVKALVEKEKLYPNSIRERKSVMAIYEKAIHLTATDCNETYVMRGISQFFDPMRQEFMTEVPHTIDVLSPTLFKVFKSYPVSSPVLTTLERFEEVMRALYSKRMIEKEILYYNFIEYKYEKRDGKKARTSNSGHLISPRPKQKFGCDKIMSRIVEMLDHEREPNYYTNKLRRELRALEIPSQKIEEIILLRERYCNNKYVYSLLMQYAAGFGKSNIIGWTALQLKDFRYEGRRAYDKIMIVVDRLQLRDQIDTMMMNMNIDKSMFIEAKDKATFIEALASPLRIIVVNIQKFLDLQQAISESEHSLRQMRVAFLIDEIHRSNSGENNKKMIDIFACLQESFKAEGQTVLRKNLLIGFTATPSDETLTRFGEFRSATTVPMWVPFDCYSMREAIEDGYILDPTKHIIPYAVPVDFRLPEELEGVDSDDIRIRKNKERVYSFKPRMEKIAKFIVERLVSLVYGKIHGEGKAMLAVSSIPNAIRYYHILRELYAQKCQEPMYARYRNAPIAIVYSDDQTHESCATLNGGLSEATVIQNFRNAKNGLIIVVDKLQTGFDESKLHTLFLDKEISDINAIQTISRVNRICKYKTECHVIDCSWKNVNGANIRRAFRKYCDMVVSDFNPERQAEIVASEYQRMKESEPYVQWFSRYQRERENTQFILEMEDGIRTWVVACFDREMAIRKHNETFGAKQGDPSYIPEENAARDLRALVGNYISSIRSLEGVFDIDARYYDKVFLSFWNRFCNIYKDAARIEEDDVYEFEVIDSDKDPGITITDDNDSGGGRGGNGPRLPRIRTSNPKGKSMEEVLEILKELNDQERLTAQQAQVWLKEIGKMFQFIRSNEEFCALVRDGNYSEGEKLSEYKKVQARYSRSLRNRTDIELVEQFRQMLTDNTEQLFAIFLADFHHVENEESDFDYDTTTTPVGEDSSEVQTMDDLMELVRHKMRPEYNEKTLKQHIIENYTADFQDVRRYMRSMNEVVNNFFMVLNTPSLPHLDGLDDVVKESLNMVCMAEGLSLTDKRMHMNMLLIRYEVYLKKLYYLIHNEEIQPREEGQGATLSNAIHAFPALRGLKNNPEPAYQAFYQRLDAIRHLRNDESHSSMELTEQEVDRATRMIIDMYLFVTGTNITELEMAGHDADKVHSNAYSIPQEYESDDNDYGMAAETFIDARELTEPQRIEVLEQSILQLLNHGGYKKTDKTFCKQRHWLSVYRIAADEGFIIEGDFSYFKQVVDRMNLPECNVPLNIETLERKVQGIYGMSFAEWNNDGLSERQLTEYNDSHHCAEVFLKILSENRPKR